MKKKDHCESGRDEGDEVKESTPKGQDSTFTDQNSSGQAAEAKGAALELDEESIVSTTVKIEDKTFAAEGGGNMIDLVKPKLDMTGSVLDGRYRILAPLGEGGMSTVYKAEHVAMNAVRAVKVIHPKLMGNEQSLRRFQQEAASVAKLQHANIIAVHDCGVTADGRPYIAMDFIEGRSLADVLRDEEYLERERAIEIFIQLTDALEAAHNLGIIHRDLKPSNIMLTKNVHAEERAKILDFGVAKVITQDAVEESALTQTGEIFGSPLYMSPEQCQGTPVDLTSDVYSLGCVMYECLTGSPPIRGATIFDTIRRQVSEMPPRFQQVRPKLGGLDRLEAIVFKCLAKEKEKRYAKMSDLRKELVALRGGTHSNWKLVASAAHDLILLDLKLLFSKSAPGSVASIVVAVGAILFGLVGASAWMAAPLKAPPFEAPEKLWQVNFKPDIQVKPVSEQNANAIDQLHQMNELLMLHGKKRQLIQRDFLEFGDRCFSVGAIETAAGYYKQAASNIFPGDRFLTIPETIRCFVRAADLQFLKGEYKGALNFYERALPMLDEWSEVTATNITPVYTRAARSASLAGTTFKQLEKALAHAQIAVNVVQKDSKLEKALAMTVAADLNRQLAIGYASRKANFGVLENSDQSSTMLNAAARMYSELADISFVVDRPQRDFVVARFCHGLVHEKLGNWKIAAEDFAEVYPHFVSEFGQKDPITKACLIKEADAQWQAGNQFDAILLRFKAKLN
jgi:serine/threonine protein kinase/tetratricopeptide (TPR) repeat protein